jgi:hypothetical protein
MPGVSLAVVREQRKAVEAALHDEQVTRARVDNLEAWARTWHTMGFWRRMRWLVLGR